jgi:hypothetical protein
MLRTSKEGTTTSATERNLYVSLFIGGHELFKHSTGYYFDNLSTFIVINSNKRFLMSCRTSLFGFP